MITCILRHDGVDLGTIVQESHTTLPIYPQSSYVLNPMLTLKGVQIQEGSLWGGLYTLRASIWGPFAALGVVRGVQAPFMDVTPPCCLTVSFPLKSL